MGEVGETGWDVVEDWVGLRGVQGGGEERACSIACDASLRPSRASIDFLASGAATDSTRSSSAGSSIAGSAAASAWLSGSAFDVASSSVTCRNPFPP